MSAEITYKTHILIGVRENGVMTVIADWPHVPKQAQVAEQIRRFRSSLLALASLDHACRDQCPDFSATLTTVAFDHSRSRWLGIDDLIAEPEGPSFISSAVAQRRLDRRCS